MRHFSLLAVTAATVIAVGSTAAAAQAPAGKGLTMATSMTTHASSGGGKPTGAGKPTAAGKPTTSPASAKGGGSKKPGSTTTSGESTTTTADTTVVAEANAISTKIANDPSQLAKVTALLEGTGLTLEQASTGFRNQGQFLAALNVSKNRPDILFVDLKAAMVDEGLSLGQAAKKVQAAAPTETTTTVTVTTGTEGTTATGTTGDTSTTTSTTTPPAAQ